MSCANKGLIKKDYIWKKEMSLEKFTHKTSSLKVTATY